MNRWLAGILIALSFFLIGIGVFNGLVHIGLPVIYVIGIIVGTVLFFVIKKDCSWSIALMVASLVFFLCSGVILSRVPRNGADLLIIEKNGVVRIDDDGAIYRLWPSGDGIYYTCDLPLRTEIEYTLENGSIAIWRANTEIGFVKDKDAFVDILMQAGGPAKWREGIYGSFDALVREVALEHLANIDGGFVPADFEIVLDEQSRLELENSLGYRITEVVKIRYVEMRYAQ